MIFDYVIKRGLVINPQLNTMAQQNIGIQKGKIAYVGVEEVKGVKVGCRRTCRISRVY